MRAARIVSETPRPPTTLSDPPTSWVKAPAVPVFDWLHWIPYSPPMSSLYEPPTLTNRLAVTLMASMPPTISVREPSIDVA